ncbi:MAG: 50S ribosomal protein L11 methyltransferase [Clostridia bacterium]|nr:50S ribosomal protein L11 methyltransferase [Clostridia bacterium]
MTWSQLKVTCKVQYLDILCDIMSAIDPSIMVEDYSDIETGLKTVYGDLIDEFILNSDKTIASCSIYVPEDQNINEHISFIKDRLADRNIDAQIEVLGTDEEEWSTAWRKYYKPTAIGHRMVVVPSWEEYTPEKGEIVIDMDPGLAFGTGTHETTRLCAELLEENIKAGDYLLDVGSGSGILAICASKLGAAKCAACDIDPVAVRTEVENAERNHCENIDCYVSDLLSDVRLIDGRLFDVVTANIVADIIIRMSPDIGRYIRRGGYLIASGIIEEREAEVDAAVTKCGFEKIGSKHEKGWCAELFRKL